MKKRTHKILSWVLTIAMVLGMLPAMSLPAAAAEEIYVTHVDLLMDAPKAGMTVDEYAATIGIDNTHPESYNTLVVYRNKVNCYRVDDGTFDQVGGTEAPSFVEGGVYQCFVTVDLSDNGYAFAHDNDEMTVLVNGLTLDNYDWDRENGYVAGFTNKTYYLYYDVYFTAEAADSGLTITGSTPTQTHATWSYVQDTNTLTLNGYNGGGISASGMSTLTLVLEGTNVINGNAGAWAMGIDCSCNLTIKGSGSLTIKSIQTETSKHARAVSAYTITQDGGDVTVNVESVYWHQALRAQTGIYLNGGKLTVNATDKNPSANGGSQLVYTHTGEILVGKDAELTVNVTNQSSSCADIAVYNAAEATTDPTNNGDITIRGKVTITRTKDSHATGGAVSGIITASNQSNTDGVITISDGADVTITDTGYAIVSNAPEVESRSDIMITGGTVNITSGISGSVGLKSKYNGISITGGTVNVHTDAIGLNLDYAYNKNGIIHIGGSAEVSLISDNSYAVYTCDSSTSTRVHTLDFTESTGSFTAKSNNSSFQYFPVQAYFQLGTNTYLSEGSGSSNDAGTGQIFGCDSTTGRVKVAYSTGSRVELDVDEAKSGTGYTWTVNSTAKTATLALNNYTGEPFYIDGTDTGSQKYDITVTLAGSNTTAIPAGRSWSGIEVKAEGSASSANSLTVRGTGTLTVTNGGAGHVNGIKASYIPLTIHSGTVNVNFTAAVANQTIYGIYNSDAAFVLGENAALHVTAGIGTYTNCGFTGIYAKDATIQGALNITATGVQFGAAHGISATDTITFDGKNDVEIDLPYGSNNCAIAASTVNYTYKGDDWVKALENLSGNKVERQIFDINGYDGSSNALVKKYSYGEHITIVENNLYGYNSYAYFRYHYFETPCASVTEHTDADGDYECDNCGQRLVIKTQPTQSATVAPAANAQATVTWAMQDIYTGTNSLTLYDVQFTYLKNDGTWSATRVDLSSLSNYISGLTAAAGSDGKSVVFTESSAKAQNEVLKLYFIYTFSNGYYLKLETEPFTVAYGEVVTVNLTGVPEPTLEEKYSTDISTISGASGYTITGISYYDNAAGSWLDSSYTADDADDVNIYLYYTAEEGKSLSKLGAKVNGQSAAVDGDVRIVWNYGTPTPPNYSLTKLNLSATVNLEPLMSYDSITTTVPEEDRDKYDIIVLGAKLYGSELGTAEVADPGEQLTLTVGVAAKAPYLLTTADLDSLKVQVGGHGAGPVIYYSGGGYAYKSVTVNGLDYWEFSVSETFTVPAYTFSAIDFTIAEAAAGESPSMTAAVTDGDTLPASKLASSVEWTDLGTDGNDNTAITAGSKFQTGHYYECRVKFTLSDANYLFPGVGGMTITANGKTISETTTDPNTNRLVSCFAYEYDLGSGSWCYTVYLRGKLAEEGKVDLTGVSRDGGTISYTILPSGEETSVHVLVAQYQDGKLVDVKLTTLVITGSDAIAGTIEGFTPTAGCTYKVFLLEDGKYIPLCLAVDLS